MKFKLLILSGLLLSHLAMASDCGKYNLKFIKQLANEALNRNVDRDFKWTLRNIRDLSRACGTLRQETCVGRVTSGLGVSTYNDLKGFEYSQSLSTGAVIELASDHVLHYRGMRSLPMVRVKVLNDFDYGQGEIGKYVSVLLNKTDLGERCKFK